MVGRAFVEALRFGASGGAGLGLALSLMPTSGPEEVNVFGGGFVPSIVTAMFGAVVGTLFAYAALIAGSIAADLVRRWVGALVAFLVTFALVFRGDDLSSPWVALPVGVATYAGAVAWCRIPRILGH